MLVTVSEAAEELGVCAAHIRKKIRQGEWPAYHLGSKATRLDLAEIKRIARDNRQILAPAEHPGELAEGA
jgi:excisionase family DNA binding protein